MYQVIFDISKNYELPNFVIIGIAGAIMGGILFIRAVAKQTSKDSRLGKNVVFLIIIIFGLSFTTYVFMSRYPKHTEYTEILKKGRALVVEGPVENFRPEPWQGHAPPERFTVSGVKFEYSFFSNTPGFHTSSARGGPIKEGLWVRIHYTGDVILKLEVKQ